jgi:hypothetical protein
MTFYDERGRAIELAAGGASGGEGTVHRIVGDSSRVAKIYHMARLTDGLHGKLRVMLDRAPNDAPQHRSIAWVDGLVFADRSGNDFRGFTMPYVDTTTFRQAHAYYDASDRLREFGGAFTWRHLTFAAHNLASAVAAVHAAGHCVGDLRETNLLVAPTALVTLIDCDSFQIRDPRTGDVHPTRVATGDYLPPELQGVDFHTDHPDRYHADLFALAVLVFRFLMLGVHPFQSRGEAVADAPSTEAKIARGLFAFGGRHRGLDVPEYAPPFSVLPRSLRALTERAFVRGHRDPDARPAASEWAAVLGAEGRRLRRCDANDNHWFAAGSRGCPWCRMSPDPFPSSVGRQIALESAGKQAPEAARVAQLREYAKVALADGAITDRELTHLRKAGAQLGLRTAVVDRVVDDEARRAPPSPAPVAPPAVTGPLPAPWTRLRATITQPLAHVPRSRRALAAWKAAGPVLLGCAVAGALAPVAAPAVGVVAVPALATYGDQRGGRGWRRRLRAPLFFVVYLTVAVRSLSRVLVPLALAGAAAAVTHVAPLDVIVRILGAVACLGVGSVALLRLPSGPTPLAEPLRSGRDELARRLTGDSGRMRRPGYVVLVLCAAGVFAIAFRAAVWWPLAVR